MREEQTRELSSSDDHEESFIIETDAEQFQEGLTSSKRLLITAITDLSEHQRAVHEQQKIQNDRFLQIYEQQRIQNDRFLQIHEQHEKTLNDQILGMQKQQQTLIGRMSEIHDEQKVFNQTLIEILKRQESRQTHQGQSNAGVPSTTDL